MLHRVVTSEKVPFTYRVAGLGARFLAWLFDLGMIALLLTALLLVAQGWEMVGAGVGMAVFMVTSFAVQWGYFVVFEWLWHGQTPGKRVLGIRVIQERGTAASFTQAAVRNILRVVDGLPLLVPDLVPVAYGVGFLVAASNRENRRLGDLAAGTLVVYVEDRTGPIRVLAAPPTPAQRERAAQARQRLEQLGRQHKQTLLDLCLRRDQLRLRERARLFSAVAGYFKTRLDLAPQEYESDEKFVLQMIALLTTAPGERGEGSGGSRKAHGSRPVGQVPGP
ncbi:MAG: RDD family protein [Gemmataceae bacterium]|nr:RDD family protein [Gemmataceae bacterium]